MENINIFSFEELTDITKDRVIKEILKNIKSLYIYYFYNLGMAKSIIFDGINFLPEIKNAFYSFNENFNILSPYLSEEEEIKMDYLLLKYAKTTILNICKNYKYFASGKIFISYIYEKV